LVTSTAYTGSLTILGTNRAEIMSLTLGAQSRSTTAPVFDLRTVI
jgi:hypothetical protein